MRASELNSCKVQPFARLQVVRSGYEKKTIKNSKKKKN